MKPLILTSIIALFFSINIAAQQIINGTLQHDGMARSYLLYVPASYNASEAAPLLMSFHGLSSSAQINFTYTDFKSMADAEGFVLVHPQGTTFNNVSHWNVGGFTLGSTVDDVGFVSALIDKISNEYTINQDRIYSTGMSNGGYMSFLLACQLSDKIAAIASVTGSMTPQMFNACNPLHPTPILQIHGTKDATVPYEGSPAWTKSIDDVVKYWQEYNHCNSEATITNVPNLNTSDGSTVDKFVYGDGDNCVSTEHFKVYNGVHDWPGAWGNMDINASKEVWSFLSKYDMNGLIGCSPTSTSEPDTRDGISIYPNPAGNTISVKTKNEIGADYTIFNNFGAVVGNGHIKEETTKIDVSSLVPNSYVLKIGNQSSSFFIGN